VLPIFTGQGQRTADKDRPAAASAALIGGTVQPHAGDWRRDARASEDLRAIEDRAKSGRGLVITLN
jgi:hypothetical protein